MFFPRLRRQAKWVFVFLAAVFGFGFVFFGVGSGSGGISDALQGNFSFLGGGGSGTSSAVSKAEKAIKKHPNDASAWKDLGSAYLVSNKPGKANGAYLHALRLRPKDTDALTQVASYYTTRGTDQQNKAALAQGDAPLTIATVLGDTSSPVGQALGSDPVSQLYSQRSNLAFQKATTEFKSAEAYYKRLAPLRATDANTQFQFAEAARAAGDYKTALVAYRRVIKVAPNDPSAATAKYWVTTLAGANLPGISGR
jgi:tetratricopeptide (TPR) repeat protein